jgi:hypothetical protein
VTELNAVRDGLTRAKLAKAMAESDERLARYLKQLDDADKRGQNTDGRSRLHITLNGEASFHTVWTVFGTLEIIPPICYM